MKFSSVAEIFKQIEEVSGRLVITRLLAELFKQATAQEASIIANLTLGQLHAPYVGTQFNLAEKTITPVIADIIGVESAVVARAIKKEGDIGDILASHERTVRDTLSVSQVYDALVALEKVSGIGSQEEKAQQLKALLLQLDPLSGKYVVRMVIGKLRLGFSDMTIIDSLSWMEVGDKSIRDVIENAYNICADLGLIAATLKENGVKALEKMHIKMGIPIRPAAAERLPNAQAVVAKLGACVAQPKLDGFRLQIHIDNTHARPRVHFFSRNLIDMSAMFPDITRAITLLNAKTIICEGEAIGYDPNTGNFLPFQETVKRKRKHGIEQMQEEFPLKVFLFDILYLNGKDLLTLPHEERRALLVECMKKVTSDQIYVIEEVHITQAKDLEHYFLSIVATGLEGLVVKRPDAPYQPGKRNFNWIKLKRQEEGHLEDTIDCVILGYYSGAGRRAEFGIGAFLVGICNRKQDRFETIAKIGTGLTDEEWKELKKKCDARTTKTQPHNVVCAKELIPDVWVAPEIVCIVRADEITLSPLHAAGKTETHSGYALRFPRFMGYSIDKSAEDATSIEEIKRLYADQLQ